MTRKRYVLPAVTASFHETTVGIEVRCVSTFNKWVADLRRGRLVPPFKFCWTEHPDSTEYYNLRGSFWPERRRDGIYVVAKLCLTDLYCDPEYKLAEFFKMISPKGERPSLGWCITVTVQ